MTDLPGLAIKDYYQGIRRHKLWIHDHFGPKVEMPVSVYFREEEDFPLLERIALQYCKGNILDIGAGAGAHSIFLQENGANVTALEISPTSVEVMREKGIKNVLEGDFFKMKLPQYDTLLLLMNGIGLCGTLDKVDIFLQKTRSIMKPYGCILFDSSDIAYMYEDIAKPTHYYGEVSYQYQYKNIKTDWFNWLYIDPKLMQQIAEKNGFNMEILFEDENSQYLAKLTLQ